MDIEQRDHEKTVAVMRELAGLRTRVPAHRADEPRRPPFSAELDMLRARVRALAQAIAGGGTMERSAGSSAASNRRGKS